MAAAPGAALAQSGGAGDDQYVDPIGGNSQQHSNSGGSNSSSGSNGPTLSNTPTLNAQASPTTTASSTSGSTAQTLPRTGADPVVVAAFGAALLLAGAVLRRRLRHGRL